MANTGNTQQQINYGAAVNDGNGDPLRTAFIKTDDNFDNVWLAGPVGSNITITNNTIQANDTNGNLILSPNGTGAIQTNSRLLPRLNNTYDFGSTTLKYRTGYFGAGGLVVDGNVTVAGNLTAGNISYTGNVFVGDLKGSVYADDSTIMVDAVDNELFASRATISGNITADYFVGNGSQLTGLAASYGNANVVALLSSFGSNTISTTGNISGNLIAPGANGQVMYNRSGKIGASPYDFNFDESTFTLYVKSASFSGEADGTDALYVGSPGYTFLGSDIMSQFTGNVNSYSQINFQNINPGALASGDYIITADNGTDSTYYLDIGLASSNHADPGFFGDTSTKNDAYIYVVGSDETGPSSAGGPGNLILGSTNGTIKMFVGNTAQANVVATIESDQLLMSGNIIPATSNVYSLGNATNQWSDLYVSNATIYMNNVPISLTAGNILTVNGADVVTTAANGESNVGNLEISGTVVAIAAGATDTLINITPSGPVGGWAFLQLPTNDTANTANTRLHNAAGNVEFGTGDFSTGSTDYIWTLDNTGNLTLPANGDINFNGGSIAQTLNEDIYIRASDDESDGWSIYNVVDDGAGNILAQTRLEFDQYTIRTDAQGAAYTWAFRDTGVLDLPGDIYGNVGGNLIIKIVDQAGSDTFIDLQTRSHAGDALISNIRIANPNVTISTANAAYNWTFEGTGNLTVPGNTVVSTANATGNVVGKSINIRAGAADQTDYYATAGGNLNLIGGLGASNDGGGGGPGGAVNITSGLSADPAGHAGNVTINAGSNTWTFDYNGVATLPGEGVLQSLNDTVTLASLNTTTGNANSVYLGSAGGLGFFDQGIGGNWLEIFRNGAEPEIRVPVGRGNLNIQTAEGINAYNWTFDNTGNLSAPGNIIANIVVSTNNGNGTNFKVGDDTWLGDINLSDTLSIRGQQNAANAYIVFGNASNVALGRAGSGPLTYGGDFSVSGNITGNTAGFAIGYRDIPQVSFTGNATIATTDAGKHFYSTQSSNYILTIANNASQSFQVGAAITIVNQGSGTISIEQGSGVTLYLAGNASSGNRSVATFGMATIMKVATDTWFINGTGVS
jgi:hypothetical protein